MEETIEVKSGYCVWQVSSDRARGFLWLTPIAGLLLKGYRGINKYRCKFRITGSSLMEKIQE
jgi:hypothetical protein